MDQSEENKSLTKSRLINFYNSNKFKIYIFLLTLIIILISFIIINHNDNKKNIFVAEKYIEAGIHLSSNKKEKAKKMYEEIIFSKNMFYSTLALNILIEKNLISEKDKIIKYFEIIEKSNSTKEQKDLLILKKALYLIKVYDTQNGNILLKDLVDRNTTLASIAKDLLKE
jgi:hypothetical protein